MRRRRIHSLSRKMTQMVKQYMVYTFQVLVTRAYIYISLASSIQLMTRQLRALHMHSVSRRRRRKRHVYFVSMRWQDRCVGKYHVGVYIYNTRTLCGWVHYFVSRQWWKHVCVCIILCPDDDENTVWLCTLLCVQTMLRIPCGCVHYPHDVLVCIYIYISYIYTHPRGILIFVVVWTQNACVMLSITVSSVGHRMQIIYIYICSRHQYLIKLYCIVYCIILCPDGGGTTMLVGAVSGRWWEQHVVGWKILCPDDDENAMSSFCAQTMTWQRRRTPRGCTHYSASRRRWERHACILCPDDDRRRMFGFKPASSNSAWTCVCRPSRGVDHLGHCPASPRTGRPCRSIKAIVAVSGWCMVASCLLPLLCQKTHNLCDNVKDLLVQCCVLNPFQWAIDWAVWLVSSVAVSSVVNMRRSRNAGSGGRRGELVGVL